jgi:uncharacterized membrane protein YdjX (TVP38/TMEM64 family)
MLPKKVPDTMTSTIATVESFTDLSWQQVKEVLYHYEQLGPLAGIAVPMIEAFLPFLPLVAILVANVNAYGLWEGWLLSWIGVVAGAVCVFALARRFGGRFRLFIERKYPKSQTFIHWLERRGFTLVFLLACFPFTPSSLVNIVAGISKLPFHTFITATLLGKGVMITFVSLAGQDLGNVLEKPWKLIVIIAVFVLMWLAGRKLESRYMN